jgi:DNA-binding FadR family transcriptional regulator
MILPINELLQEARRKSLADRDAQVSVVAGHRAVLEVIKDHNAAGARAAMRKHLLVLAGTLGIE